MSHQQMVPKLALFLKGGSVDPRTSEEQSVGTLNNLACY
jgi:hypothetical protein